jgi:hypothetical protein
LFSHQVYSDLEHQRLRSAGGKGSINLLQDRVLGISYFEVTSRLAASAHCNGTDVVASKPKRDLVIPISADIPLQPSRYVARHASLTKTDSTISFANQKKNQRLGYVTTGRLREPNHFGCL